MLGNFRDVGRFVPPASQPTLDALLKTGSAGGVRGELVCRAEDGTAVPIAVTFAPLWLEGSTSISGVIGVVVDVTERKREEELRTRLIEQVMTAQDDERARVARELHDETGQSLTALLVGLRTLEGVPRSSIPERRASEWAGQGWARIEEGRIVLTVEGWLRLDALAGAL